MIEKIVSFRLSEHLATVAASRQLRLEIAHHESNAAIISSAKQFRGTVVGQIYSQSELAVQDKHLVVEVQRNLSPEITCHGRTISFLVRKKGASREV